MEKNVEETEDLFPPLSEESSLFKSTEVEKTQEEIENESLKNELEQVQLELEEGEIEDNNTSSHEGNNSSPSVVSSLALALRAEGVLTTIDEEKLKEFKDAEELIAALVKDREESSKSEFTETQWKYIEALRNGVPEEDAKADLYAEEAYSSISKEDLESNAEMQKQVYFNDLVSNGIPKERADKIVTNAVNTGTLLEDSTEALSSLQTKSKAALSQKIEAAKVQKENSIKENAAKVSKLKDDFLKTEEFSGIPLNEAQRVKAFELMTKVVETDGKTPLNAIYADRKKDVEDFEKRQALAYMLTNGFKDFSLIKQKESNKAILDLKAKLAGEQKSGGARKVPLASTTEDMLSFLRREGIK